MFQKLSASKLPIAAACCSVKGCAAQVHVAVRGLCALHYQRLRFHGDPNWRARASEDRFWSHADKTGDCWLWVGARTTTGYGHAFWKGRYIKAHRVAFIIECGPIPRGMYVCHKCDTPLCVRPDHLFLGTPTENMVDASRKGRLRAGDDAPWAKLSAAKIRRARALRDRGWTHKRIAELFGVSRSLISYWERRGFAWRS